MKRRTCERKPVRAMLVICLVTGVMLATGLQLRSAVAADLVVKITRLHQALDLIDSLGTSDTGKAPTDDLRGMLQELDWIDDGRSIVLSWEKSGEQSFSFILVPFRQANPNFKETYNAISRKNYYILSLPPGPKPK